jgi:hypothetical protein
MRGTLFLVVVMVPKEIFLHASQALALGRSTVRHLRSPLFVDQSKLLV